MKKISKLILPVIFIGFLVIVATMTLCDKDVYSENEKRYLAAFPEFSWETLKNGEFTEGLEKYMSDHFWGRDFFVGVDSYCSKTMGKNALNDIYITDDDYLINAPEDVVTKEGENHFEKNMSNIESFAFVNGVDASIIIVPSAGYVMEDKLPKYHAEYKDDELIAYAAKKTPSVKFYDAREALINAYNSGKQVYYRTDHHITSEGSYALYSGYCQFRGLDCPSKDEYTVTKYDGFYGTTYSGSGYWLTEPDTLETWDLGENVLVTMGDGSQVYDSMFFKENLKVADKYPVFLNGNQGYVKIENPTAKGGTLLVVRDSFGQNFVPFLAHNYKEIYMIDLRYYRNSLAAIGQTSKIDEVLFIYGIDTLLTDSSTSYLFL